MWFYITTFILFLIARYSPNIKLAKMASILLSIFIIIVFWNKTSLVMLPLLFIILLIMNISSNLFRIMMGGYFYCLVCTSQI